MVGIGGERPQLRATRGLRAIKGTGDGGLKPWTGGPLRLNGRASSAK